MRTPSATGRRVTKVSGASADSRTASTARRIAPSELGDADAGHRRHQESVGWFDVARRIGAFGLGGGRHGNR